MCCLPCIYKIFISCSHVDLDVHGMDIKEAVDVILGQWNRHLREGLQRGDKCEAMWTWTNWTLLLVIRFSSWPWRPKTDGFVIKMPVRDYLSSYAKSKKLATYSHLFKFNTFENLFNHKTVESIWSRLGQYLPQALIW